MATQAAATATNRFGLGAMPGELARAREARGWLHAQLEVGADVDAFTGLPTSSELLQREAAMRRQRRQARAGDGDAQAAAQTRSPMRSGLARDNLRDIATRYRVAATTQRSFAERIVRFWSNHFAVSADKGAARLYAAPMEREAIRRYAFGNFVDLLIAVESHPAMLRYLDNVVSVGEDSMRVRRAGRRADAPRRLGLNENLAREILELHTLGVDGGYVQDDVLELARAITGWSVLYPRRVGTALEANAAQRADGQQTVGQQADGQQAYLETGFVFRARAHEPGARRVLGKTYAEDGFAQGRAVLRDLALHPATARHLSAKLARHFVADAPDPGLVDRMAKAFLASGGELRALYAALIDDDAAWAVGAHKYKTPDDFVVSAMRAGGFVLDAPPQQLVRLLRDLGQPVFTPRSPEGFPDGFADWAAGDALRKRLQTATTLAARVKGAGEPLALAREVLGEAVPSDLGEALRRAGSPQDGYALLFASPAFQWRA